MNKPEFKVGDKVKFGDAEGEVTQLEHGFYPVIVKFVNEPDMAVFTDDGFYGKHTGPGFPRLTLVSRPERFVEKEVYHPVGKIGSLTNQTFETKEDAINYPNSIGYAVSKVFIKESES